VNRPFLSLLALLFFLGACAKQTIPNLQEIYNPSAQQSELGRNPIILIPGLLGSKLVDKQTGTMVWGAFGGGFINPSRPKGARLLALPMKKGVALRDLRDDVEAVMVLDTARVRIWGLPIESRTYFNIIGVLGSGGYRDETLAKAGAIDYGEGHFTCFQFPYDWRRDVVEIVADFQKFLMEKKAYVEAELERLYGIKKEVKFNLITHSHGGLLARYYLRFGDQDLPEDGSNPKVTWAGAQYIEKAILIGPPNAGSLKALNEIVKGRKIGTFLPTVPPAVGGTFPALYQMLPRGRHKAIVYAEDTSKHVEDLLDPELWVKMNWGLADPNQTKVLAWLLPDIKDPQERLEIALDHQRKSLHRAKQFMAALDLPVEPPHHLKMFLIAGDAHPTDFKFAVDSTTGKYKVIEKAPGDKTVTRSSALMDERVGGPWDRRLISPVRWHGVTFIFNDHLGLTKDPVFADNILYQLLESQE